MNKHLKKITHSARGEVFNPLLWPFLISTLSYGVGFIILASTKMGGTSSLYVAMDSIIPGAALVWGTACIATIVFGLYFLLFNVPPLGKFSGLMGFSIWAFAGVCYLLTGNVIVFFAVALPNLWFWFWQYLSLSVFRQQDMVDDKTMRAYNDGQYDDVLNPIDSKRDREENRINKRS